MAHLEMWAIDGQIHIKPFVTDPPCHADLKDLNDVKYATWQPECRAVMLEIVPTKIHEKVAAAEAAMAKRLPQITSSEDHPERRVSTVQGEALRLAVTQLR